MCFSGFEDAKPLLDILAQAAVCCAGGLSARCCFRKQLYDAIKSVKYTFYRGQLCKPGSPCPDAGREAARAPALGGFEARARVKEVLVQNDCKANFLYAYDIACGNTF